MTTGGTERQLSPFLGDGIAQSFGLVPLVATGTFDLTPGMLARSPARARRRVESVVLGPFRAISVAPAVFPVANLVVAAPLPRWRRRPVLSAVIAPRMTAPAIVNATAAPALARLAPDSIRQAIRYRTDVIAAWSGLESRISLATIPRESLQLAALLDDGDLREVRAQLFAAPAATVRLPLRAEDAPALADITGVTLTIDTTLADWPAIGGAVLVENLAGQAYTGNVVNVTGYPGAATVVTLDVAPPSGQSYPAGSRVAPLVTVYLADGAGGARLAVAAGRLQLAGTVQPPRTVIGTGATLTTFDGLTVMDRRLNAEHPAAEQNLGRLQAFDAGGAMYTRTPVDHPEIRRSHVVMVRGKAERQWLRLFLQAVRGRQVAWLLPTWKPDLVLVSQPLAAATTVLIDSTEADYLASWWPSSAHRRLQLEHADGSVTYVTVGGAVDNGNGTQTLTVSSVGAMLSPITTVSLLELVRLEADEIVIDWQHVRSSGGLVGAVSFGAIVVQR